MTKASAKALLSPYFPLSPALRQRLVDGWKPGDRFTWRVFSELPGIEPGVTDPQTGRDLHKQSHEVGGRDLARPAETQQGVDGGHTPISREFLPDAPGGNERKHIMEERQHPAHPVRELALQLACGHQLPDDTAETIVDRAGKYAAFLSKG